MADKIPPWFLGTSSQLSASGLLRTQPQVHRVKVPIKVEGFPTVLIEGNDGFIFKNIYKDTGATCKLVGAGSGFNETEPLHILIEHSNQDSLQHAKRLTENLVSLVVNAYIELCNKKTADQQKTQTQSSAKIPMVNVTPDITKKEGTKEKGFIMFDSLLLHGKSLGQTANSPKVAKPDYQSTILLIGTWNLALADDARDKLSTSGLLPQMILNSLKSFDIVCVQNTRMNWGEHKFGNYNWYTAGNLGGTKHGVAILVNSQNKDLKIINLNRLSEYLCTATFEYKDKHFKIICCLLPPPGSPLCSSVRATVTTELAESNVFTVLLGDFNAEISASDLTKEDLLRMGTSHYFEKSNENGLYLTSLSRANNLKLVSSLETSISIQKYHVLVSSLGTYECKVLSLNKANSPSFANQILRLLLRPKLKNNENKVELSKVNSPKVSYYMKNNESTCGNLWTNCGTNAETLGIASEEKIISIEIEKSEDFQANPFKRTFRETNENPFEKFQPKIAKMNPYTKGFESSRQESHKKQHLAETITNLNKTEIKTQSNLQSQIMSNVPATKVKHQESLSSDKTTSSNINDQQNLESQDLSSKKSRQEGAKVYIVPARRGEELQMVESTVWCNNIKCKLRVVPKSLDSFYSSISYQLFPCIDVSDLANLSQVLHQRTINYIRSKKDVFFIDVCNLYNSLFPNHGYDPDFTFEHGCLYLLSKPGSCGEMISARAITALFNVPIVILEELKFEKESSSEKTIITLGPYTEILPEPEKTYSSSAFVILIKRISPENHYDAFSTFTKSVYEFLKTLTETSINSQ